MLINGSLRHLGGVAIGPLQDLLPSVSETVWTANPIRQEMFAMHRQTRSLIFRYIPDQDPMDFHDLPPFAAWRDILQPVLAAIEEKFLPGHSCRILLANLPKGSSISMHRDSGRSYELTHRIHVPICTDPRVNFRIGDEEHFLEAGQIYEINNLLPHGVNNASDADRVHLIVDYLEYQPEAEAKPARTS